MAKMQLMTVKQTELISKVLVTELTRDFNKKRDELIKASTEIVENFKDDKKVTNIIKNRGNLFEKYRTLSKVLKGSNITRIDFKGELNSTSFFWFGSTVKSTHNKDEELNGSILMKAIENFQLFETAWNERTEELVKKMKEKLAKESLHIDDMKDRSKLMIDTINARIALSLTDDYDTLVNKIKGEIKIDEFFSF